MVLQTALQAGCAASGIEKMKHPASIAERHLEQFQCRCRMWGVEPGPVELLTGDFTDDNRVRERILDADVVLCNNWAFSEKCMFCSREICFFINIYPNSESIVIESFSRHERRRCSCIFTFFHPPKFPID